MFIESNNFVLNKLRDEYYLPEEMYAVLNIIEENKERIRFVKDHNGVKNLIFISTIEDKDAMVFEVPYFLITTKQKTGNYPIYETRVSSKPDDIVSELTKFFSESTETMFVGIGFIENEVTKWDYMQILNTMEETKCNLVDAYVTFRRFPDWYAKEADLPIYIHKEEEYLKEFENHEKQFLLNKKQEILNQLHSVVENNNESEFEKLSNYIRAINNQLNEYNQK